MEMDRPFNYLTFDSNSIYAPNFTGVLLVRKIAINHQFRVNCLHRYNQIFQCYCDLLDDARRILSLRKISCIRAVQNS